MKVPRQPSRPGSAVASSDATSSPINADLPIPSIEDRDSPTPASDATSTTSSRSPQLRTPSVSVTPPAPTMRTRSSIFDDRSEDTTAQTRSESHGINSALERMRVSSPGGIENLSDVNDAIDAVARGSDSRSVSLAPDDSTAGTPQRKARRRRSSSKLPILPHDVKDEELPQDAFHSPSFQNAFRKAKILMSRTRDVLGSNALHSDPDSTMRRLYVDAGDLACFNYPSTRTVGFVGDSGVGKSSLLNSLLDFQGLARTSNSGEACTCVVTEYHYHENADFDIEVELFSMEEISDQLSNLLGSYRHFHFNQDEMDPAEKEDMEEIAKRARDTFRSMFCDRMEDEDFLVENSEEKVLRSLISWAADARPSDIRSRESGLSLQSCSARLMELSSEPASSRKPAKWPFIRKMKLFLNAHILSKGLVLVDLPGLHDMNLARRRITERFVLECDEIFVICNIGRAVTDAGVESVLELARKAQLSNVGIICTRSDDIQADEAKKDWKGQRSQNIQRLNDAVAADKRDDANIEAKIANYERFDDLSDDEERELSQLNSRQRLIRKRRDGHEFELHAYLVTTRNSIIERKLKLQYNSKVPSSDVRVFCVSNKNYWDHRTQPSDVALPYLQLSGILEVRKYCISIVANSQHRIASLYMNQTIPDLYAQIQLWVQSGAGSADAEGKEVVRSTLERLENRLKKDLSSRTSSVNQVAKSIKHDFAEQIYERRQISEWSEAAIEAGYEWSGWHHSSYAAFCRKYGDYCTSAAGKHNWNEEAIEQMVQDLKRPWAALCSCVEDREVEMEELLEDLNEWATELLENDLDIPEITQPLLDALESQQQVLLNSIEQIYEEFGAGSKTLRTDVMSGIQTSLIGQAMESAYRACNRESGTGSHARQKGIINGTLARDDLFRDLMKNFKKSFHLLADEAQMKISITVALYLSSIHGTLDIILSDNVALESEQDPAFRRRVDEDAKAGKEEIDKVKVEIRV